MNLMASAWQPSGVGAEVVPGKQKLDFRQFHKLVGASDHRPFYYLFLVCSHFEGCGALSVHGGQPKVGQAGGRQSGAGGEDEAAAAEGARQERCF